MTRYQLIAPTLIVAILMIVWAGCPGSSPTITLTATNCAKDQIGIDASKTVTGTPGNYNVVVTVTITCGGEPLPDAEIKYTNWLSETVKLTTDADGKARHPRRVGTSARPSNLTVTVEIEGSDGTKTQNVTV